MSYAFIVAVICLVLVLKFVFLIPGTDPVLQALAFAILLPYIYFIGKSVLVTNKFRPLKGKLQGVIVFEKDAIMIADQQFALSEISKIEIEAGDWLGLEKWDRGLDNYFENTLSRGVDNKLKLILSNGTTIKTKFLQLSACEFREIEDIILHYYLNDKISYLQTVDILCLSKQEEWNRLKALKSM
ncbi:hypothetical protein [Pontibacter sp. Tf4]|uniref:hypothetical protein n=1 Tax=Pontibacter sp. Tf4 TaxID=2761620 RepID=UPI001628540E|nr:hypothetical protein [Pontibacter sp. Tf4]